MGFAALYPSYTSHPPSLRRALATKQSRVSPRDGQAFLDRLLRGADRHRRVLGDHLRPAQRARKRLALWHDLVDEAELMSFLGADMARGEDHAHRALQTDLARQPVQAAGEC